MRRLRSSGLVALSGIALSFGIALSATACGGDDSGGGADATASSDSGTGDASSSVDARPNADARPTFDATPPIDAKTSNLSCLGDPLPTTAPATVTLSGMTFTIAGLSQQAVPGVLVTARRVSDDSSITSGTSDGSGNYSMSASTGGVPLDGYLEATESTYFTTWLYPPTPVFQDNTGVATIMVNQSTLNTLALIGVSQDSQNNGMVAAVVLDCAGQPIEGATVTTNPAGAQVIYNAGGFPDTSATSTGSDGIAIITNVPAGTVTIDADVSGMSLREHDIKTATMTITSTAIVP